MYKRIISYIGLAAILGMGSTMLISGVARAAPQNTYGTIVAGHSRMCLDVPNGSTDDNIGINQFQCDNSPEQSFALNPVGNGYYNIVARHSGKCFDVPNASTADNIGINQFHCDNSPEQRFALKPVGNDYYNIVTSHSGKCLNVPNGSTGDNVGITQFQCNGQTEQMFWFSALPAGGVVQQTQQLQQQQLQQQQAQQQAQQLQQQQLQQQQLQRQQASSLSANTHLPVTRSTIAYLVYNDTSNKVYFETYDPARGTWMPASLDPRMQIEIVPISNNTAGLQIRINTQGKGINQYTVQVGGSYRLYTNPQTIMWDLSTIQAPGAVTSSPTVQALPAPVSAKLSLQSGIQPGANGRNRIPVNRSDPAYTVEQLDISPAIYLETTFADGTKEPYSYHEKWPGNVVFDDISGDPYDLIQVSYWDVDNNPQRGKFAAQLTSTGKGVGTAYLKVSFRNAPGVYASVPVEVVSGAQSQYVSNVPSQGQIVASSGAQTDVTEFTLSNDSGGPLSIFWIDGNGVLKPTGNPVVMPGQPWIIANGAKTWESHWFALSNASGFLCSFSPRQRGVVYYSQLTACPR